MAAVHWIPEPPALELEGRPAGSKVCLGPPSGPQTDLPGYGTPTPQAFLATFCPDFTLKAHFHRVDQFQWFIRGGGRMGTHEVAAGTVHFADRYTPYGPLHMGPNGAAFLTLRTTSDTGAHFMPDSRRTLHTALRSDMINVAARRNNTWNLLTPEIPSGRWCDLRNDIDGLRIAVADVSEGEVLHGTQVMGAGAYLAIVRGRVESGGLSIASSGFAAVRRGASTEEIVGNSNAGVTRVALFQFPTGARASEWVTTGLS